jgi:serine/threonine protein kinase
MSDTMPDPEPESVPQVSGPKALLPALGEVITSEATNNTYTIGVKIGEGNFGIVYACTDVWCNDLAVKVLKQPDNKTNADIRRAAEQEFDKLLKLRHPNVTYVHDAFEFRDTFYIVTEQCHYTLRYFLAQEWFNGLYWLMPIARCLLQAVHYLHTWGYAHQDIHAGNVFTAFLKDEMNSESRATQFKLGDLGVSKLFDELDATNTLAEWIRPPEAIEPATFGPLDRRIDIYHLGLLLLEIANSRELHFTRQDILDGKPREMALQLPAPYNSALEKALRRHVQFRTETAMELWRDLNSPLDSNPTLGTLPELNPPESPTKVSDASSPEPAIGGDREGPGPNSPPT